MDVGLKVEPHKLLYSLCDCLFYFALTHYYLDTLATNSCQTSAISTLFLLIEISFGINDSILVLMNCCLSITRKSELDDFWKRWPGSLLLIYLKKKFFLC